VKTEKIGSSIQAERGIWVEGRGRETTASMRPTSCAHVAHFPDHRPDGGVGKESEGKGKRKGISAKKVFKNLQNPTLIRNGSMQSAGWSARRFGTGVKPPGLGGRVQVPLWRKKVGQASWGGRPS